MTVYGVITSAILRKLSAFIREIRALVVEAKVAAEAILTKAETDAKLVIAKAKREEAAILGIAEAEAKNLEEELIAKIAKL